MSISDTTIPKSPPKKVVFDFLEELRRLFGRPKYNESQKRLVSILKDKEPPSDGE